MRILWVSHLVPYPPKGGVLQRSFNLLREVARYHTVDLVAFVQRPFLAYLDPDPRQALRVAEGELSRFCGSVRVCPLPQEERPSGRTGLLLSSLFDTRPYTVNWLKSRRMAALVREHVARGDYQVAHLDTFSLGHYLPDLAHVPAVMNHHNIESQMMARRADNERNPLKRAYMRQEARKIRSWERRYGLQCAFHTTCSRLDSERLLALVPELRGRVDEVPNGVDIDYFRPTGAPTTGHRLVFAGRLSAYPNRMAVQFIARELWPLLKQAVPEISMDIIGADPPPEVVQLAREDGALRVHGFVNDVRPYLENAAVYVCPITDGGGTKLKMLDALAMGKAVVADPIACEGIDVTDGVDVVMARTPREYVERVAWLLQDQHARLRIGAAARALIESRYAYEAIGRKLSAIYESVSKGNGETMNRGGAAHPVSQEHRDGVVAPSRKHAG